MSLTPAESPPVADAARQRERAVAAVNDLENVVLRETRHNSIVSRRLLWLFLSQFGVAIRDGMFHSCTAGHFDRILLVVISRYRTRYHCDTFVLFLVEALCKTIGMLAGRYLLEWAPSPTSELFLSLAAEADRRLADDCGEATPDRDIDELDLSVRTRNLLKGYRIHTLASLCRHTEQDLRQCQLFRKSDLNDIRKLLATEGLKLADPPADQQALLSYPVSTLGLSLRARNCMAALQIETVGDLVRHTDDDLLRCTGCGLSTFQEIDEVLTANGLKCLKSSR